LVLDDNDDRVLNDVIRIANVMKRFSGSRLDANVSRVHPLSFSVLFWMASKNRFPRRYFVLTVLVLQQALLFTRAKICDFKVIEDQVLRKTVGFVDGSKSSSRSQFELRLTSKQAEVLAVCVRIFSRLVDHSVDFCWKAFGWEE
jgi:hypothetical protein